MLDHGVFRALNVANQGKWAFGQICCSGTGRNCWNRGSVQSAMVYMASVRVMARIKEYMPRARVKNGAMLDNCTSAVRAMKGVMRTDLRKIFVSFNNDMRGTGTDN